MPDTKIQQKEGQGAIGTGFEGKTGSNSYSALPKSSNAGLGIDAEVASGVGFAVSNTNYGQQINVGAKEVNSSRKNLGYDEPWAKGTVGATEGMGGYGPVADDRGQFGESALAGSRSEGSTGASYGAGARAKGTQGSEGGPRPGITGSMMYAYQGLKGTPQPDFNSQLRAGAQKSMVDSNAGLTLSGNKKAADSGKKSDASTYGQRAK